MPAAARRAASRACRSRPPSGRPATRTARPMPAARDPARAAAPRRRGRRRGRCRCASRGPGSGGGPRRTRSAVRPATTADRRRGGCRGSGARRRRCRVDEPEAREPLVDEPRAVELVAERVDQPRVGRRRILRLALGLLLRLGGVGRLTTASRRPSGDQASPSTSFGRSVSWRASPPSANGRIQTCVPPSFGASALPAFAPPPPACSTAPRSERKASVRRPGDQRGAVSLLLPTVSWRAGRCRRTARSRASCDSRPCRAPRS